MITGTRRNPPDGGREKVFADTDETFPFGDTKCEFPTSVNPLMCPDDWLKQPRFAFVNEVLDPDGWDRTDWVTSWAEHITADEMERRLSESTIRYHYVPSVPYPLFSKVLDPAYDIQELDPTEEFIAATGPDGKVLNPLPEGVCISDPTPYTAIHMENVWGNAVVLRTRHGDALHTSLTPDGETLKELLGRLKQAWSEETSTLPLQWQDDNPAWGQGLVTAILVQSFVGGIILCGVLNHGRKHYWNISKTGETFDLTRSQFRTLTIGDATVVSVGRLLANNVASQRYTTMLQNLVAVTLRGLPVKLADNGDYRDHVKWGDDDDKHPIYAVKMSSGEDDPRQGDGDITFDINTPTGVDLWDAMMASGTELTLEYLTGEKTPRFETFRKNLVGGWEQK